MQSLSSAKWSYVTRRVEETGDVMLGGSIRPPALGDFVLAKVEHIGAHVYRENPRGRRVRLYPGDLIVGAYGNRYATDFYEGYLPGPGDEVHLLTSGGLIGTVASAHTSKLAPTELKVLGPLVGANGAAISTDDVAAKPAAPGRPELGTVVVLGSAMNAGKTTTTSAIARGLSKAGLRVGAAKVTGSGSGKDHWDYLDAGADTVIDFLDFGMPSTFGYPVERLVATMFAIRDLLVEDGADAVVMEVADGVLQGRDPRACQAAARFRRPGRVGCRRCARRGGRHRGAGQAPGHGRCDQRLGHRQPAGLPRGGRRHRTAGAHARRVGRWRGRRSAGRRRAPVEPAAGEPGRPWRYCGMIKVPVPERMPIARWVRAGSTRRIRL